MTSVAVIILALWITAIRCFASNDTCDERYSRITTDHTMCKSINENCNFLRRRGKVFEEQLLHTHNSIRNSIRKYVGKEYHLATNMKVMQWHDELYAMARLHSLQCAEKPDCDLCHQIGDFPVEQNFAVKIFRKSQSAHNGPVRRFQTTIKEWAAELRLYNRNAVKSFRTTVGLPTNWTNILRATTIFVGCASMNFKTDERGTFKEVYVCNYGPANLTEGEEIYKAGKNSCSECEDGIGCDTEFKHLCFPGEVEEEHTTEIFPEEKTEIITATVPSKVKEGYTTEIFPEEKTGIVRHTVPSEEEETYSTEIFPEEKTGIVRHTVASEEEEAYTTEIFPEEEEHIVEIWPKRRSRLLKSSKVYQFPENATVNKRALAKAIAYLEKRKFQLLLEKLFRHKAKGRKMLHQKSTK